MADWELAGRARRDFADMMESLTPEQAEQQSLCEAWTAHGVLAHLTSFVETGLFGLFGSMIGSGFDFDKVNTKQADKRLDRSVADLAGSLRDHATKSAPLPTFPEGMTVADVAIHTQDVRRPLGLDGALDPTVQRAALDFLTTQKLATTLVDRPSLDGIQLSATDTDWTFGEGAEISGPAEAIMMGLAGRPVLDELSGDGVDHWR